MILEGVMLMLVGMGFVFVFLVILNVSIHVLTKLTHKHTVAEFESIQQEQLAKREKNKKDKSGDTAIIAAIVAAVKK